MNREARTRGVDQNCGLRVIAIRLLGGGSTLSLSLDMLETEAAAAVSLAASSSGVTSILILSCRWISLNFRAAPTRAAVLLLPWNTIVLSSKPPERVLRVRRLRPAIELSTISSESGSDSSAVSYSESVEGSTDAGERCCDPMLGDDPDAEEVPCRRLLTFCDPKCRCVVLPDGLVNPAGVS